MSDYDARDDDPASRIVSTIAGNGSNDLYEDNQQIATHTALAEPQAFTLDQSDNIYFIDNNNFSLRKIDAISRIVTTITSFQDQIKHVSQFKSIWCRDLTFDRVNNRLLFITLNNSRINCFDLNNSNYSLLDAMLYDAQAIIIDRDSNIYISEGFDRQRIQRFDPNGKVRTLAGRKSVQGDFGGDDDLATKAYFNYPTGLAFDSNGHLFIADSRNHRIRRIDSDSGIITTVAGNGKINYRGDDKPAIEASLNTPMSIAFDDEDNLFIADTNNHAIRRVDAYSGIITTIAGNGQRGFQGDDGPARDARLNQPQKILFDLEGNLLIADRSNHRIRVIKR